jgi:Family of unknown function (DUF5906)/Bifunctional DNA primase/polymerase, N-terminal
MSDKESPAMMVAGRGISNRKYKPMSNSTLQDKKVPHQRGRRIDALALAVEVLARGWHPVALNPSTKTPIGVKWQLRKITRENISKFFSGDVSVGVQMGPKSNGLTDIDLDCGEAVVLAPHFMPKTDAIYGRVSKRASHRLYYTSDPEDRAWIQWKDDQTKVILELRMGGGGKGAQSVAPGSIHTSGEVYEWDANGEPAKSTCAELKAACIKVAVGALLMRHWPSKGALHDCALGVGGFLARAGWKPNDIEHFIFTICKQLPDVQKPKEHGKTAHDSAEAYAKGEPVRGLPWMCGQFGDEVANAVAKILDYHGEAATSELTGLNEKYCVVLEGGKVRVLSFSKQHGREMVNHLTFSDFKNLYMNKFVVVGKDEKGNNITSSLGAWWLKHPDRRQYNSVTFEPCKPVPAGTLNLWRGWGIEPAPGDWSRMQQHIFEVLASGDSEYEQYILNYAAWCVQHPGTPAEVALVFKGPEGTGRGIFARAMCRIFGQHAHQISSIKHLTGDFNKHLRDCCMLFADEAFWPGHRSQEGTLKRLITEPTLFIEPKGLDAFEVKNMIHLIMVSNNKWVIPASMDARRFVMFEVSEHKKQDPAWFEPLYRQMENGGYAAMLHDLLKRDLGDWHPRQIIKTAALYVQQMLSLDTLDPFDAWWYAMLKDGILPGYAEYVKGEDGQLRLGDPNPRRAYSHVLFEHARNCVPRLRFESNNALGYASRERGCVPFNNKGRGWEFPALQDARAAWQERVPGQLWDDELEDWQERTEAAANTYNT